MTVMQTRDEVEGLHNCLEINIAFLEKYCHFVVYKQFICKREVSQYVRKCTEFTRISAAALIVSPQKCGAYLIAVLNTIAILLSTVY